MEPFAMAFTESRKQSRPIVGITTVSLWEIDLFRVGIISGKSRKCVDRVYQFGSATHPARGMSTCEIYPDYELLRAVRDRVAVNHPILEADVRLLKGIGSIAKTLPHIARPCPIPIHIHRCR